ncbi:MAG: RnfABCDGE type electron transport complex subunit D [Spirochaetaceae bacterium]|jgi:electron transport complex protein RnfD|nr:RnfABCDGE type electron transport complex subunit D [Spirochaetaceae bacterium]
MNYTLSRPDIMGSRYCTAQKSLVLSTTARMYIVAVCAFFVILQSSLTDNFSSMRIALFAVLAGLVTETLICLASKRHPIYDGSVIVTALVLTMLLPNTIHPGFAVFGVVFAIAVVRFPFGGLGANWLNPALGGALAVRFSWSAVWQKSLETSSLESQGFNLAQFVTSTEAETVSDFLNEHVFALFNARLPPLYVDLFSLPSAGIIADRGFFALAVGSVIIVSCAAFRLWMPFLYLAAYLFLVHTAGADWLAIEGGSDMLYALCSGGTLVTAFYLLADPVTGPKSNIGSIVYALTAALLTFVFRFLKMELYGAFFAIAFLNTLLPMFRVAERRIVYEKGRIL